MDEREKKEYVREKVEQHKKYLRSFLEGDVGEKKAEKKDLEAGIRRIFDRLAETVPPIVISGGGLTLRKGPDGKWPVRVEDGKVIVDFEVYDVEEYERTMRGACEEEARHGR